MSKKRNRQCRVGSIRWRLLPLVLLGSLVPVHCTATESAAEYGVKAAYLLNFAKFIAWPPDAFPDPQSSIAICVLGKDPFGPILDEVVQGESANGHKLMVRRISEPPSPQTCQVLFVDPELKDLKKVVGSLGRGVLTVSEGDQFIRNGGMISLVVDSRRVRFDINQAASEDGGLKLSSKLLGVARSVVK